MKIAISILMTTMIGAAYFSYQAGSIDGFDFACYSITAALVILNNAVRT